MKRPNAKKTNVKIKFDQLFTHNNNNFTTDFKCDSCNFLNKKLNTSTLYDFDQTKYLIVRIELSLNNFYFLDNVKITDFNPDFIKIPGSETIFYVKTAILYYPNNINHPRTSGGHYTCLKRIENSCEWIEIDDLKSSGNISPYFIKNLANVYILVLEKIF